MTFEDPIFLWGLLLLLPTFYWMWRTQRRRRAAVSFSSVSLYATTKPSLRQRLTAVVVPLRVMALAAIIIALARPITEEGKTVIKSKGIEIVICLDLSDSMRAMDLEPNRLEVAKDNIANFIQKRKTDRIGLVVFGQEALLRCPLTLDHRLLREFLRQTEFSEETGKATAIGMSLSTAILSLKNSKAKTKLVVLLTDGVNNAGDIDPITAAELCKVYDIKVYTIGMGKPGLSQVFIQQNHPLMGPVKVPIQNTMDEETLKNIASTTGGRYFNVQDKERLAAAYDAIDKLEKVDINAEHYINKHEQFWLFLWLALALLAVELFLKHTLLKIVP